VVSEPKQRPLSGERDAGPSPTSDLPAQIAIAQEALEEANRRREVARNAVVDFALRAVVDGQDIEGIMDACGFKEVEGHVNVLAQLFGTQIQGTRRQRFAYWLGQELANRIAEGETDAGR
jgi:hypothetical protein